MQGWIRNACVLVLGLTLASSVLAEDAASRIIQSAGHHRLLVIGEIHGTRETPKLVEALLGMYAAERAPVYLALELPTSEDAALQSYLDSSGDAVARAALRSTPYWNVGTHLHDGRRSEDMLDLIDAARVLRTQGHQIQVGGFDRLPEPPEEAALGARDAAMADEIRQRHATLPGTAQLIVLTGNVHGMRTQPTMVPYPPMTALLSDLDPYNVRIEAREGEFWGCRGHRRCGSQPIRAYAGVSPMFEVQAARSYDMWVWLPRFTVARLLD